MLRNFIIAMFIFGTSSCRIFYHSGSDTIITEGQYSILSTKENNTLGDSCLIQGFVFDRRTNTPLAYSYVIISKLELLSETDTLGYFRIISPPGYHKIEVKRVGNFTLETDTLEFKPNIVLEMKFDLGSEVQFETDQ